MCRSTGLENLIRSRTCLLTKQEMKPQGAAETTAMSSEERDYIHLLQGDGRMTKSTRCLTWENISDCGKEVSYSIRKLVDSGRSKLKKKQLHDFAQLSLPPLRRHGGAKSPTEAHRVASIAKAPKSILYYA